MMGKLDGKVAIITGAGSGIGRASALLFAEEGAKVVIADLNEDAGTESVELIQAAGGDALFVSTDVRRGAQVESMVNQAAASFGTVDILYNNAAIEIRGSATQLSEEEWDATMGTSVKRLIGGQIRWITSGNQVLHIFQDFIYKDGETQPAGLGVRCPLMIATTISSSVV